MIALNKRSFLDRSREGAIFFMAKEITKRNHLPKRRTKGNDGREERSTDLLMVATERLTVQVRRPLVDDGGGVFVR